MKIKDIIEHSDIIHVHDSRTFLGLLSIIFALRREIPIVLHPHGTLSYRTFKNPAKSFFDFFFLKTILKSPSKIIALNESERNRIWHNYGMYIKSNNVLTILPNGISISKNQKLSSRGFFRESIGFNEKNKVLLYLGRLHHSKNLIFLLKSFSEVNKVFPEAKLVFIGPDDGMKSKLVVSVNRLNIDENVKFVSSLYGKMKISALLDSDLVLIPSYYGFPLTILEACFFGRPVVTTNHGDVISNFNCYCGLVTPFNINNYTKGILNLLTDHSKYAKYSKNAKRFALNHNWDRITEQLIEIYNNL